MAVAWIPDDKFIKGCIAFVIWWLLAVFPAFPLLPVGRTAGSVVGAALMVLLGVISPDDAFNAVNISILGLLFATMVISVFMERAKAFDCLTLLLSWRTQGGVDLLCRVCLVAAVSSAVFTNDSTCVVLTSFVLKLCRKKNLNPKPFLIALACSANIGSAATPIGNPQNLVIAVQGKLGFGQFVLGVLPAVTVGFALNTLGLLLIYGRSLSLKPCEGFGESIYSTDEGDPETRLLRPSRSLDIESGDGPEECTAGEDISGGSGFKISRRAKKFLEEHRKVIGKSLFFLSIVSVWILGATLQVFESGVGLPWTAITAAMVLTVVDFSDATVTLDKVSYSILVFFSGMFITVEAFNRTGAPAQFWSAVEPYSRIDSKGGMVILSIVVTFLSNVASNVPTGALNS